MEEILIKILNKLDNLELGQKELKADLKKLEEKVENNQIEMKLELNKIDKKLSKIPLTYENLENYIGNQDKKYEDLKNKFTKEIEEINKKLLN